MANKNDTSNPYANTYGQLSQEAYAQELRRYMPPGAYTHSVSTQTAPSPYIGPSKGQQYSLAEVQLVSGGMIGMTINASIKIVDHLLKNMKETGFLHLRNEAEAIILRADEVRAFKLTQLTTEG